MFTATVWKNFACIQITSHPIIHEMPSAHLLYKNGIAVEKGLNGMAGLEVQCIFLNS